MGVSREYYRGIYHCTVNLLFDWFGLVCFANTFFVSFHTTNSKPVKQEVNGTVILPTLVFPEVGIKMTMLGVVIFRKNTLVEMSVDEMSVDNMTLE